MTQDRLGALATSLASTFPGCDDARLSTALVRQLALGRPVTPSALASAAGYDEDHVLAGLRRWPNVHRDAGGRVIAFSGLTLEPTVHRFEVAGRRLHTWCAWDTLFLPAMLGETARVGSRCPVTGATITLTVDPHAVRDADPEPVHVSFPQPASACTDDIVGTFCCHVHFLAGDDAADRWRTAHRAVLLTLEDAFEVGRLATRAGQIDAG